MWHDENDEMLTRLIKLNNHEDTKIGILNIMYVQGSPTGRGRREIPGVTQVPKEHSRILLCWREDVIAYHSTHNIHA